ncbi:MAG: EscU/YscU/HrcU family type III secretion system export apparatus switch protein, partial [Proteobacteria bacterium]|nr:EscU/YscU/HrcU family type III secretion system export apparatus switch protein [Pseudomonadota bacterium]
MHPGCGAVLAGATARPARPSFSIRSESRREATREAPPVSEQDQQDKTEQPTEKRLREAREKGQVPRSRELGNVAVLGATSLAMLMYAPGIGVAAQGWLRDALTLDPASVGRSDRLLPHAAGLMVELMLPVLPVILVALGACLIAPAVMGGIGFSNKALQPDFTRLDPMKGFKRIYGKEGLAELLRSLLRVLLVIGVGAAVITLGERGALFMGPAESGHVPAFKVADVVETTGAGDAFTGGFAVGLARGMPALEAVRFGCAVAG